MYSDHMRDLVIDLCSLKLVTVVLWVRRVCFGSGKCVLGLESVCLCLCVCVCARVV